MIKYNYCPQCKKTLTEAEDGYPHCDDCKITFYYRAPHPAVGVIPIKDGKALLAIRGREPNKGSLDLIGGFLEAPETLMEALRRESLEETGLEITPTSLLGIYTDRYGKDGDFILAIHYLGVISSGTPTPNDDVAELRWYPIMEIPDNLAEFQGIKDTIRDLKTWFTKQQA